MNTDIFTFTLPQEMLIRNAAALSQPLIALLEYAHICVDASALRSIDTAGLQQLTSLFNTAKKQGLTVEWHRPSVELCDAARQLGLLDQLGL